MSSRRLAAVCFVLGAVLLLPAVAWANAFTQVQSAYLAAGTGTLPACEFPSSELTQALRQAPGYAYQYESDFTDAVGAALAARAGGRCSSGRSGPGAHAGLGPGVHLRAADTRLPGSVSSPGAGGLPLVLALGGAVLVAALIGAAVWFAWFALGLDPRWLRAARHSVSEAEHRAGAGWEDMLDRFRR